MNSYFDFQQINEYCGRIFPSTVSTQNNMLFSFYQKYFFEKALSIFEFELPKNWDVNYFKTVLFSSGYIAILDTDKFGVIPQMCGLYGYDIFYEPSEILVTNSNFFNTTLHRKIGVDGVLVRFQTSLTGILDIVNSFAELATLAIQAVGINLINCRVTNVFGVDNKSEADKFKKLYDNVASGEPAVFYKNNGMDKKWDFFSSNLKNQYLVSDLLSDVKKIENMFNTMIGIPNTNTEKRERMNVAEVTSNNGETRALSSQWLKEIRKHFEEANVMFNLELKADWNKTIFGGEAVE